MKICKKCNSLRPLSEFKLHPSTSDGLYTQCKACDIVYQRQYRVNNKNKIKEAKANYYSMHRETILSKALDWQKRNSGKVNAKNKQYKLDKIHRTPKWLTTDQLKEIKQFYIDAEYLSNLLKIPFEVDHIIPLRGEFVSGLHVPSNLQLLSKSENSKKSNLMGAL